MDNKQNKYSLAFATSSQFAIRTTYLRSAFTIRRPTTLPCYADVRKLHMSAVNKIKKPSIKVAAGTYMTRDPYGIPALSVRGYSSSPIPTWLFYAFAGLIVWLYRRYRVLKLLSTRYKRENLSKDIADFYDYRSAAWETVWGEHMHHGLYDVVDGKKLSGRLAQVRTMTEMLEISGLLDTPLPPGAKILDVGCGIGGASRFLARRFGPDSQVTGITLSPYQAERATYINQTQGLENRVVNEVRNALDTGFPDEHFDVIWSLESGEHMEDKHKFLQECSRVLKPGGKMVMLAWCIRESTPPLKLSERYSIRKIMEEYCLPRVAPPSEYGTEMIRAGLRGIYVSDWTTRAAPFWGEVVRSSIFNRKGWKVLMKYGWPLIRSALAMRHVIAGIRQGVFRLVAFSGRKRTLEEVEIEAERKAKLGCSTRTLPEEKDKV